MQMSMVGDLFEFRTESRDSFAERLKEPNIDVVDVGIEHDGEYFTNIIYCTEGMVVNDFEHFFRPCSDEYIEIRFYAYFYTKKAPDHLTRQGQISPEGD